ncbi:MAG: FAD-dependent oxidoreductase, partial [bacterium]|nr:FAD-dependent oxidoreductase [bacterium]
MKIERNVKKCSETSYDVVIVGGGIYGAMLALEAVRKNLRPLVLEKNDFSGATSLNHLRTVHGGLRYLQSLDLFRFKESVKERKWFLRYFPQYVNPMPCILPLYGKGIQRNSVLGMGLVLNDLLSITRNAKIEKGKHLPKGKILSSQQTAEVFPEVNTDGLTGSALWYDAAIQEYQRMLMEILKLAT